MIASVIEDKGAVSLSSFSYDNIRKLLQNKWHYLRRPLCHGIIASVLSGQDNLSSLKDGHGKV